MKGASSIVLSVVLFCLLQCGTVEGFDVIQFIKEWIYGPSGIIFINDLGSQAGNVTASQLDLEPWFSSILVTEGKFPIAGLQGFLVNGDEHRENSKSCEHIPRHPKKPTSEEMTAEEIQYESEELTTELPNATEPPNISAEAEPSKSSRGEEALHVLPHSKKSNSHVIIEENNSSEETTTEAYKSAEPIRKTVQEVGVPNNLPVKSMRPGLHSREETFFKSVIPGKSKESEIVHNFSVYQRIRSIIHIGAPPRPEKDKGYGHEHRNSEVASINSDIRAEDTNIPDGSQKPETSTTKTSNRQEKHIRSEIFEFHNDHKGHGNQIMHIIHESPSQNKTQIILKSSNALSKESSRSEDTDLPDDASEDSNRAEKWKRTTSHKSEASGERDNSKKSDASGERDNSRKSEASGEHDDSNKSANKHKSEESGERDKSNKSKNSLNSETSRERAEYKKPANERKSETSGERGEIKKSENSHNSETFRERAESKKSKDGHKSETSHEREESERNSHKHDESKKSENPHKSTGTNETAAETTNWFLVISVHPDEECDYEALLANAFEAGYSSVIIRNLGSNDTAYAPGNFSTNVTSVFAWSIGDSDGKLLQDEMSYPKPVSARLLDLRLANYAKKVAKLSGISVAGGVVVLGAAAAAAVLVVRKKRAREAELNPEEPATEKTPLLSPTFDPPTYIPRKPRAPKPGLSDIFALPPDPVPVRPEHVAQRLQQLSDEATRAADFEPLDEDAGKKADESEDEWTEEECTICAIMLGLKTPHKHRVLKKAKGRKPDFSKRFRSQLSLPPDSREAEPRDSSGPESLRSPGIVSRVEAAAKIQRARSLEEEIEALRPSSSNAGFPVSQPGSSRLHSMASSGRTQTPHFDSEEEMGAYFRETPDPYSKGEK